MKAAAGTGKVTVEDAIFLVTVLVAIALGSSSGDCV